MSSRRSINLHTQRLMLAELTEVASTELLSTPNLVSEEPVTESALANEVQESKSSVNKMLIILRCNLHAIRPKDNR